MLRMNFISLPVINSADGGRRSYPKLSKCNKTASFRIPRWGSGGAAATLDVSAPPSGNAAPSSGCPLAPPLITNNRFETTRPKRMRPRAVLQETDTETKKVVSIPH